MYGVRLALVKGKAYENFFQGKGDTAYTPEMLCQFNIMVMAHAKDSPQMAQFFAQATQIYALAERLPGFVWRQTDESDPVIAERLGPSCLVNLTVWDSIESLYAFVLHPTHRTVMMARDHWFTHTGRATSVLWYQDAVDSKPTFSEAIDRLEQLWRNGPGREAFDFSWAQQQQWVSSSLSFRIDP